MSKEVGSATVRRSKLHLVDLAGLVNHASAHSVKRYGIMYLPHTKIILLGSASLCTEDASVMSRE